jgi:DNA-binding CsgD family transcriptional regulator
MSATDAAARGRAFFSQRAWSDAYAQLAHADSRAPLDPGDLEQLASAAYLIGHDAESVDVLARAQHEWAHRGQPEDAARCAFWAAFILLNKGQRAPAGGWLARARRLLDENQRDSVIAGYLLLPVALQQIAEGKVVDACGTFAEAARIGLRFRETDLVTLARMGQGRTLIAQARVPEGIALMDEVMVTVTTGEASPIIVGTVYCSVIEVCHDIYDLRRAHEWTDALSQWCAAQPDLVPYRGHCLVRRAEIMQLHGAWSDALDEAQRACELLSQTPHPAASAAFYQQAELHRLRGERRDAEVAYKEASQLGRMPRPGLALLRLADGHVEAAAQAIRRMLDETPARHRPRVLPAYIEIMLAARDVDAARTASDELSRLAASNGSPFLRATAVHAEGAVRLAGGDARGALAFLREASAIWCDLEAPYERARAGVLIGLACRALGDHDTAAMQLDAARHIFLRLGASPDVSRVDALSQRSTPVGAGTLTAREIGVLRLLATGKTNRAIAEVLGISEKTVARHVSNIFTKLDLSSRAEAAAYAFRHGLMTTTT